MKSFFVKTLTVVIVSLVLASCSDSATNPGDIPDPPEPPTPAEYQPKTEYFSSNAKTKSAHAGAAFETAAQLMNSTVSPLFSASDQFLPVLQEVQQGTPSFEDGIFSWTTSTNKLDQEVDIELQADPSQEAQDVNWALIINTDTAIGLDFNNYQFMTGNTATDGNEGNWSIYPYEDSDSPSPIITYNWVDQGENSFSASYVIAPPSQSITYELEYSKNQSEHTLSVLSGNDETDVEIAWDTDTGNGYIDRAGSEKVCWNSALETVPCQ